MDETPGRAYTVAAIGLALLSIIGRRTGASSPRPRARIRLGLLSLVAAGGIGLIGVGLAFGSGQKQTALLYVVAGAILSLRPPSAAAPSPPDR